MSNKINKKEFVWIVVSAKTNKTRVVVVEKVKMHPLYKKRFTIRKKYYVHDENNITVEWQKIRIQQTRPISKLKRRIFIETVS